MDLKQFEQRKRDHLQLALDDVNQAGTNGLERITLMHCAIPELNFADLDVRTDFWGYSASSPFFISSMTAGHSEGEAINIRLARFAGLAKWPMGLGSQRRELIDPGAADEWRRLRKEAPDTFLMSNIGISQIIDTPHDQVLRLVENVEAKALFVHCNALQEVIQPEGTPNFAGALIALEKLCRALPCPVILKETGCGFSVNDIRLLANTGLAAIDISGYGGTHWGRIEGGRAAENSVHFAAAKTFANWGISTAVSLEGAAQALLAEDAPARTLPKLWASGGIRSGLDGAKCIALGAEKIGFAKPALEAALRGEEPFLKWAAAMEYELKVALFCTGSSSLSDLREGEKWQKI